MKIAELVENKDGSLTVYAEFTPEELAVIVKKFFDESILDALTSLEKQTKKKKTATKRVKARR